MKGTRSTYERIYYEHFEDGFYVVGDEGYTEAEWLAARHICTVCSRAFVNLSLNGEPVGGGRQRYCSEDCYKIGRRAAEAARRRGRLVRAA